MGQLLHGSARTTAALRRTIQHSQESIARLAARYDLNAKTVAKWRKRTSVEDAPMGPRQPHSTVLTMEQEAVIVAFRQRTLLALDDCLYALQASILRLTRSSLHRCLQRHGLSRLPEIEGVKPAKKKFAKYAIGYFHVDIAEVHTGQGRLYLFVAINRTSKFAFAELHPNQTRDTACHFLRRLIAAVPYRIHTILTDNGIQFTNRLKDKWAFKHLFNRICEEHGIEHRLTKVNHPWTNGQVERMNRTIKDATVKRYHYETHDQLKEHLAQFLAAYNFAKRLKTLRGLTPYEYISRCWQKEPERFRLNPHHHSMGLNNYVPLTDGNTTCWMDWYGNRWGMTVKLPVNPNKKSRKAFDFNSGPEALRYCHSVISHLVELCEMLKAQTKVASYLANPRKD